MMKMAKIIVTIWLCLAIGFYFYYSRQQFFTEASEATLERVTTDGGLSKYLVFNGSKHALVAVDGGLEEYDRIYSSLAKGDKLIVKLDRNNVIAELVVNGRMVSRVENYYEWRRTLSARWLKLSSLALLAFFALWLVDMKRKS